jgi:hypothetical protein
MRVFGCINDMPQLLENFKQNPRNFHAFRAPVLQKNNSLFGGMGDKESHVCFFICFAGSARPPYSRLADAPSRAIFTGISGIAGRNNGLSFFLL